MSKFPFEMTWKQEQEYWLTDAMQSELSSFRRPSTYKTSLWMVDDTENIYQQPKYSFL